MSGAGVLTPTAAFVADPQPAYLLGSTINGWAETLAIATAADTVTVASDAEADAVDWANASGRTIAFRGPAAGGPAQYAIVRPGTQYQSVNWWNLRGWSATVTFRSADPADRAQWLGATTDGTTLYTPHLTLVGKMRWEGIDIRHVWSDTATQYGNAAGGTSAIGPVKVPAMWLRNAVGAFDLDDVTCRGNLTDFPIDGPIAYAFYGALGPTGGSSITGHLNIHDCDIAGYRRCLTIPEVADGGHFTLADCELHDFGADGITLLKPLNTTISGNFFHSPWTGLDDAGHGDFIQNVWTGPGALTGLVVRRNVMLAKRIDGRPSKEEYQGVSLFDVVAPASIDGAVIEQNLIVTIMGHGITGARMVGCAIRQNTLVKLIGITAGSYGAPWIMESDTPSGNVIDANVCALIFTEAGSGAVLTNNLTTSSDPAVYAANFVGPFDTVPTSRADLIARFTPKAGSALALNNIGAIGPGKLTA